LIVLTAGSFTYFAGFYFNNEAAAAANGVEVHLLATSI